MADLTIQGKIIQVLEPQGGTSRAGNAWRKQEYVLETADNYPKKVCFHFFGDRIDQNPLQIGDFITLYFDIESREYNGRWFTEVRAWRIVRKAAQQPQQPPVSAIALFAGVGTGLHPAFESRRLLLLGGVGVVVVLPARVDEDIVAIVRHDVKRCGGRRCPAS